MIIFCDIDGVLADCSHRLKYLKDKDYDKFYSAEEILKDEPIPSGLGLLEILANDPFCKIVLLTGRPYRTEQTTREWLEKNSYHKGIENIDILMRNDHDYRPSEIIKAEMIKPLKLDMIAAPILFIDDDPKNVKGVCDEFPDIKGIVFGAERLDRVKEMYA